MFEEFFPQDDIPKILDIILYGIDIVQVSQIYPSQDGYPESFLTINSYTHQKMLIEINEITNDDWETYKEIRLKSLSESPESFGGSFDTESKYDETIWRKRTNNLTLERNIGLIARIESNNVGVIIGMGNIEKKASLNMFQLWVDPNYREKRIGSSLIDYLENWGKSQGYNKIEVGVTTTNDRAYKFYLNNGYVEFVKNESKEGNDTCEQWLSKEIK